MLTAPPPSASIHYDLPTRLRATRAMCCAPFHLNLFRAMMSASVPLPQIADRFGLDRGYTHRSLSERRVESELLWLIKVGLLRREVDGQGITDSFRLTPLGRHLLDDWQTQAELPQPSLGDRLRNTLRRWFSFPFY